VNKSKQRIKAANNLGFTNILAPSEDSGCIHVENIKDLVKNVF
jgi:predicted ATP-dependent serine protease